MQIFFKNEQGEQLEVIDVDNVSKEKILEVQARFDNKKLIKAEFTFIEGTLVNEINEILDEHRSERIVAYTITIAD